MRTGVTSGRTIAGRNDAASAYCQGCDMRLLVGEPRASSAWPALLMLTPEQVDVLLMAAAEWEELGGQRVCVTCSGLYTRGLYRAHLRTLAHRDNRAPDDLGGWLSRVRLWPRRHESFQGNGTAVEFVDWMSVDALRAKVLPPPDHDGAPPRWEKTGVTAGPHRASHRHPFPLPLGGRGVR